MKKKYQVFISSTFDDLITERQGVLESILQLDHMPAGMELFPASDDTAWNLIKDVIDASDYYILLIGGRYGSLDSEGIGYTEKEYDYAIEKNKPVLPFLHKNPESISRSRTDIDKKKWNKLGLFRKKIENKHTCNYWESADQLKSQVTIALTSVVEKNPGIGWVRANKISTDAISEEILPLKKEVSNSESQLKENINSPPLGTERLSQGDDKHTIQVRIIVSNDSEVIYDTDDCNLEIEKFITQSWNDIFSGVAQSILETISNEKLHTKLTSHLYSVATLEHQDVINNYLGYTFRFSHTDIEKCILQLHALDLIKNSNKFDKMYWQLTPHGEKLMFQLRAVSR